jgi:hypothetical protein
MQKGKATIIAGQDNIQINFSDSFINTPIVNISCKENVNVYLLDVTKSYITVYISSTLSSNLEINYVALEKEV